MFGAYKSSCAVLNRTSKVLGSDIAQWIVSEQKKRSRQIKPQFDKGRLKTVFQTAFIFSISLETKK